MVDGQLHLKALFYQMQPETLLASMDREDIHWYTKKDSEIIHTTQVPERAYLRSLRPLERNRSEDELAQSYRDLEQYLQRKPVGGIFSLLNEYSQHILTIVNGQPEFLQEAALEWREMSLRLGQDLFTCSMLARQDLDHRKETRRDFLWRAVLRTNSPALKQLTNRGLAENHFHLNGSTQNFSLTWGFLMNHPKEAKRYFSGVHYLENLHDEVSLGEQDNHLSWPERIYLASWLRAALFARCENLPLLCPSDLSSEFKSFRHSPNPRGDVQRLINRLRLQTGDRFVRLDGKKECLDYAISLPSSEAWNSRLRFLTGERRFLYHCFYQCYSPKGFTAREQDLFYLYLLLKAKFRNELIQNNDRYGFRNFSEYQDRKSEIWEDWPGYWLEAGRLASAAVQEGCVTSLEMRVMPWKDKRQITTRITLPDQFVKQNPQDAFDYRKKRLDRARKDKRYFYVIHFPKKPLEPIQEPTDGLPQLRHKKLREMVCQRAKGLARGLEESDYLRCRIRGIDAASHEIGCRPEVFAQAFRYLRGVRPQIHERPHPLPTLRATYHVGEDFLDITDGLRAVDEAVCFLDLRRGERIGHGLALGIEPKDYYHLKNNTVRLPAQDLLDNLVWLMERSLEWGIHIPPQLLSALTERALQLLDDIYPRKNTASPSFREYFYSWALRGDNPARYCNALAEDFSIVDDPREWGNSVYRWFDLNDHVWEGFNIRSCRMSSAAVKLNYYYQYDPYVRWKGQKIEAFSISDEYIELIKKIQTCMLQKLMEKGISIECNPSSNYLIGTFRDYAKHPIFRFNNYGLQLPELSEKHIQLPVSINTDDLGVFDCSLENEYALLMRALTSRKDTENHREVSDDEALEYLEHIRRMGFSVTFPYPQEESVPERRAVPPDSP